MLPRFCQVGPYLHSMLFVVQALHGYEHGYGYGTSVHTIKLTNKHMPQFIAKFSSYLEQTEGNLIVGGLS